MKQETLPSSLVLFMQTMGILPSVPAPLPIPVNRTPRVSKLDADGQPDF